MPKTSPIIFLHSTALYRKVIPLLPWSHHLSFQTLRYKHRLMGRPLSKTAYMQIPRTNSTLGEERFLGAISYKAAL